MKKLGYLILLFWWLLLVGHCNAGFSSMYVFGDGICTTNTSGMSVSTNYFGRRSCNGRIWIEVLQQWQGLQLYPANNNSYYGQDSGSVVSNLVSFSRSSTDLNNSLFMVWAADADYVLLVAKSPANYSVTWTNSEKLFLTNHYRILTNLYAKGVRTIVMPGAVDVCKLPFFANGFDTTTKSYIRSQILDFNQKLTNIFQLVMSGSPGLTIYYPDLCNMFDTILADPAVYGFKGTNIDALSDNALKDKSINGPGASYVFWDSTDPTARAHMVIAEIVQKLISPPQMSLNSGSNGTNLLLVSNVPIGRNGNIEVTSNFTSWSPLVTNFNSGVSNVAQTVRIPATNSMQFYRSCFPFVWTWP